MADRGRVPPPPSRGAGAARRLRGERGAALALVALWLPAVALLVAAVVDVGYLFSLRAAVQAAADLGALAGAQEVDLSALASRGELRLLEPDAGEAAARWTRQNLEAHPATAGLAAAAWVEVRVLQPKARLPLRHPWSGRPVPHPTVAVRVTVPVRTPWLAAVAGPVLIQARADASVQFRR